MDLKTKEGVTVSREEIASALEPFDLGDVSIQQLEDGGWLLRFREVDETTHPKIYEALGKEKFNERRFDSIGPVVGKELQEKAKIGIGISLLTTVLYIAWSFRRVSHPVSSSLYGLVAVFTLFHDVLITIGAFSLLGHFLKVEVGIPFVAALLTILGYSVNDTIVVFDRVRENLLKNRLGEFQEIVARSLRQTFVRSFNVSLTALFVLAAIYFFGGDSIKYFALALMVGIGFGSYSSLFLASPLLVSIKERRV